MEGIHSATPSRSRTLYGRRSARLVRSIAICIALTAHVGPAFALQRIPPPGYSLAGPGDNFGAALAADEKRALIVAPGEHTGASDTRGAVYFAQRSANGWTMAARLPNRGWVGQIRGAAISGANASICAGRSLHFFAVDESGWRQTQSIGLDSFECGDLAMAHGLAVARATSPLSTQIRSYALIDGAWRYEGSIPAPPDSNLAHAASIALDSRQLVIGEPTLSRPPFSSLSGALHVYSRNANDWLHDQTMWGIEQDERLGSAVAIRGGRIVASGGLAEGLLGFPLPTIGHVVVFERDTSHWARVARSAPPGQGQQRFGSQVALAGARVLASLVEPFSIDGRPASRIVAMDVVAGALSNGQYLGAPGRPYGYGAIAISDQKALLQDTFPTPGLANEQGTVVVLDLQDGVLYEGAIGNGAPSATLGFGASTSSAGDDLYIGAPWLDRNLTNLPGRVHVFSRIGGRLEPAQVLMSSEATGFDEFGTSISADQSFVAVGAPSSSLQTSFMETGATYIYSRKSPLALPVRLAPNVVGARFGQSVALRRGKLLIGAPGERSGDVKRSGATYLYLQGSDTWTLVDRIQDPQPVESGRFGSNMIWIDDITAAVATVPPAGSGRCGRVYIIRITPSGAEISQVLSSSTPCVQPFGGDEFGRHLAWTGEHLVVLSTELGAAAGLYIYRFVNESFELLAERLSVGESLEAIGSANGFFYTGGRDGNGAVRLARFAIAGDVPVPIGASLPIPSYPWSPLTLSDSALGLVAGLPAERAADTSGGAAYVVPISELQTVFADGFELPPVEDP